MKLTKEMKLLWRIDKDEAPQRCWLDRLFVILLTWTLVQHLREEAWKKRIMDRSDELLKEYEAFIEAKQTRQEG